MLRHTVLFRWKPEVTDDQVDRVEEAVNQLPDAIGGVLAYRFQRDAGVSDGNHDACIVADFPDEQAFVAYRDHPVHLEVIREEIAPLLADRAAVQTYVDPA
ncbi:MAG: Dabb family protein [Nitriliruptoraceae bacterium]|nr:Dabb family protein [Nitriliruptoraceae bacterium]